MKPSEHKTVQARILKYAEEIVWTVVPGEEAEARRGFDPQVPPRDRPCLFGDVGYLFATNKMNWRQIKLFCVAKQDFMPYNLTHA